MDRYNIEIHIEAQADIDKIVDGYLSQISSNSSQQYLDAAFGTLIALDRACTNIEKGYIYLFSPATSAEYASAGIKTPDGLKDTHGNSAQYHFYECLGFRFILLMNIRGWPKAGKLYHAQELSKLTNSDVTEALKTSDRRHSPPNED